MVAVVRLMKKMASMARVFHTWLYRLGNEWVDRTGGWMSHGWSGNAAIWVGSGPGKTVVDGVMKTTSMDEIGKTGQSGVLRTANKVDMTGVKSIRVKMGFSLSACSDIDSGYQRIYLFTASGLSGDWTSTASAISQKVSHDSSSSYTVGEVEYSLGVTSLTGEHYICIGLVWRYQKAVSEVRVFEVELVR